MAPGFSQFSKYGEPGGGQSGYSSTVISRSSPPLVGRSESCEDEYGTELTYVTTTRKIQLARAAGLFVMHYNQDHLVFVQVSRCETSLTLSDMDKGILWS